MNKKVASPDPCKNSEEKALDAIGAYERTKDLKCLHGKILALATCQIGSKFLQRIVLHHLAFLSDAGIMSEIEKDSDSLMVD